MNRKSFLRALLGMGTLPFLGRITSRPEPHVVQALEAAEKAMLAGEYRTVQSILRALRGAEPIP